MSNKLKHLEFIQNVITRMNTNSFMIKGWCITLVAASLTLTKHIEIAVFVITIFWVLDGFYLSQERKYRDLYNEVSKKDEEAVDFTMNTIAYEGDRNSWILSIFSQTLCLIYGLTLVAIYLMCRTGI